MTRYEDAYQDALNDMIGRLHAKYPKIDLWADSFDVSQGAKEVHLFIKFGMVSSSLFEVVSAGIFTTDHRDEAYARCESEFKQMEQSASTAIDAWFKGSPPAA